jgi:glycosyltransferase involved in cell wall biosynthesis
MRVLAITNLYPGPGRELIAAFNRQQFAALAKRCRLRVIAPTAWQTAWKDRLRGRRSVGRYINADGIETEHPVYYYPPRVLRHRYGECYLHSVRRTAERAIREHRPDVLLSCWVHPDGWAAIQLGREHGIPVVIKAIGTDLLAASHSTLRHSRIRDALTGAECVIAVSRHLAEHAIRLGAETTRVRVVPEGLDDQLFFPGPRDTARSRLGLPARGKIAIFVGNLLWSKGVGVLVEACRRLAPREPAFHCYFVGRGADGARLKSTIQERRLEERISLAGAFPHAELPDWYRAADVVVLPSYSEGIPNVLREAIACGTPFLATNVGGIPEIAHPSYSRLVAAGDSTALAETLSEMLVSPLEVDRQAARACSIGCQRSAELLAECLQLAMDSHSARCSRRSSSQEHPSFPSMLTGELS